MGKFVKKTGKDGKYYFSLKADNGEIILSSEAYSSSSGCDNGIGSVKANAPDDSKYTRLKAKNGEDYFTLKAANGEVLGKSETYKSSAGMENGIASVKKNAPAATVIDE